MKCNLLINSGRYTTYKVEEHMSDKRPDILKQAFLARTTLDALMMTLTVNSQIMRGITELFNETVFSLVTSTRTGNFC